MSKYLDKPGLEHYHDLIKSGLYEYIEGTQSSATSTWTGVSTQPSLSDGKLIIYHLPYAGGSAVPTLNLTFPDGTTTGAKAVGTRVGTSYSVGSNIILVYTGTTWDVVEADGSNLIANRAVVSDANGKLAESSVTSTELGYLSGVTSGVQTQFNSKVSKTLESEVASFLEVETVNDALKKIAAELVYEDINESGTWTVPQNICGNKIFVIVVGGGASGYSMSSSANVYTTGGGSGELSFGTMEVTPGQNITAIIGAGGESATKESPSSKNGGASSFGGISANGGNGKYGGAGGGGANGGNASFGGGGGSSSSSPGGNGGTYGGGGGGQTGGVGGTYGGNGGTSSTQAESGTPYMGSLKLWNLASDYYGLERHTLSDVRKENAGQDCEKLQGGGGLGSHGAVGLSSHLGGGGGFLANANPPQNSNDYSGGALFGYNGDAKSSGAQGFYSGGGSKLRGAGGQGAYGASTSGAGGNGVVAIWYYATPSIRYLNEIY